MKIYYFDVHANVRGKYQSIALQSIYLISYKHRYEVFISKMRILFQRKLKHNLSWQKSSERTDFHLMFNARWLNTCMKIKDENFMMFSKN